jgi:hypothetical protein
MTKYVVAAAVLALAGCSTSTGVMPVHPGVYAIEITYSPIVEHEAGATKSALKEAGEFCATHGGQLYVLNASEGGGGEAIFASSSQYGSSVSSAPRPRNLAVLFQCQPPAAGQ